APHEGILRFTVKGLADYTSRLHEAVQPGMPAVVGGPHGRFDHAKGTGHQIWIAGGVGVTPFLSWFRAYDRQPGPGIIDFFYTSSDVTLPYAQEIKEIADRHDAVTAHFIDTSTEDRLTSEQILTIAGGHPQELSVFMCGPEGMVRAFQAQLRRAGVRARNIHR